MVDHILHLAVSKVFDWQVVIQYIWNILQGAKQDFVVDCKKLALTLEVEFRPGHTISIGYSVLVLFSILLV